MSATRYPTPIRRAGEASPLDVLRRLTSREMPATSPPCARCSGETVPRWEAVLGRWWLPPLCPRCQARADREDVAGVEEVRQRDAHVSQLRAAGMALGDIAATEAIGPKALNKGLEGLLLSPTAPNWVYLHSTEPGCGKTTQLQLLLRAQLAQGWSCRYVPQPLLISELRAATDERFRRELLDRLTRLDLLAIDEFGRGVSNDWNAELLLEVLDRRYSERRPTAFGSNWSLGEIARAPELGTRVSSRIQERAGDRVIELRYNHRAGRPATRGGV